MATDTDDWYGPRERLVAAALSAMENKEPHPHVSNLSRAESMADELAGVHETLRPHVLRWLESREYDPEFSVNGYSLSRIMKEKGVGVLGAFTYLHTLIVDPERALQILNPPPLRVIVNPRGRR